MKFREMMENAYKIDIPGKSPQQWNLYFDWLTEHMGDSFFVSQPWRWCAIDKKIFFKDEEDLLMFKMTWL